MVESVLLIGLGQIGMGYDLHLPADEVYTHARAFTKHAGFDLVAAVDPSNVLRQQFSQHFGRPAFATLEEALAVCTPTLVVIATPTPTHFALVKKVLADARPKVILCEKPLAYELDQAQAMAQMCEESSVKLLVNYIRRADPASIEIKRRIEAGEIKQPIKGNVWYSKGFVHNGSHFFNLLEFWLGRVLEFKVLDPGRLIAVNDSEPDVFVQFEKGSVVFQAAWEDAFSHYTIELLSPSGRLRVEQGGATALWQAVTTNDKFSGYHMLALTPEVLGADMQKYQINVVRQLELVFKDQANTLCTGRQAIATLAEIVKISSRK